MAKIEAFIVASVYAAGWWCWYFGCMVTSEWGIPHPIILLLSRNHRTWDVMLWGMVSQWELQRLCHCHTQPHTNAKYETYKIYARWPDAASFSMQEAKSRKRNVAGLVHSQYLRRRYFCTRISTPNFRYIWHRWRTSKLLPNASRNTIMVKPFLRTKSAPHATWYIILY